MASYAPLLRKLVTAYFADRKGEDFSHIHQVMEEMPIAKRDNIARLLEEMMHAVQETACQHTNVTKVDDEHETCNVCGFKRAAYWTGDAEEDLVMHWGRWRKIVTEKVG